MKNIMNNFRNYYFDAQSVKIITLITMFIDHFVSVFSNILPEYIFIIGNVIGSITFPIMAYFLVMGFYHTKNIRLYFMRLIIFWIISIIPFYLCHDSNVVGEIFEFTDIFNNIFFILLVSLLMLKLLSITKNKFLKLIIVILSSFSTIFSDWAVIGVILVFVFYELYRKNYKTYIAPIVVIIYIIINSCYDYFFLGFKYIDKYYIVEDVIVCFGFIISMIILKKLNYDSKKPSRFIKWISYIFYPTHLLFLWALYFWFYNK